MSSRGKRKHDDPNASDPEDYDYDESERVAAPQRRRKRVTPSDKKRGPKRQRRAYGGSDVDEDDEIVSDDSFTERSESEEPEINPTTGRSVRRATKKQIKYEESEEDEIEATPSADEDDKPPTTSRRRAKPTQSIEEVAKPSLIVKLKMPDRSGRNLRTRTGSKSIARGKTPEVTGTRRSSRLSHDVEAPMVALSDSGRHANAVREATRTPEPVVARATRGGKGPRVQYPSAIMEASQEASMAHDEDSPGPLGELLNIPDTQVQASKESSPAQDAQSKEDEEEDGMAGVIQESQHEEAAVEESEEEGPIVRGGRSLRVSTLTGSGVYELTSPVYPCEIHEAQGGRRRE
jgi:hypothetical protein